METWKGLEGILKFILMVKRGTDDARLTKVGLIKRKKMSILMPIFYFGIISIAFSRKVLCANYDFYDLDGAAADEGNFIQGGRMNSYNGHGKSNLRFAGDAQKSIDHPYELTMRMKKFPSGNSGADVNSAYYNQSLQNEFVSRKRSEFPEGNVPLSRYTGVREPRQNELVSRRRSEFPEGNIPTSRYTDVRESRQNEYVSRKRSEFPEGDAPISRYTDARGPRQNEFVPRKRSEFPESNVPFSRYNDVREPHQSEFVPRKRSEFPEADVPIPRYTDVNRKYFDAKSTAKSVARYLGTPRLYQDDNFESQDAYQYKNMNERRRKSYIFDEEIADIGHRYNAKEPGRPEMIPYVTVIERDGNRRDRGIQGSTNEDVAEYFIPSDSNSIRKGYYHDSPNHYFNEPHDRAERSKYQEAIIDENIDMYGKERSFVIPVRVGKSKRGSGTPNTDKYYGENGDVFDDNSGLERSGEGDECFIIECHYVSKPEYDYDVSEYNECFIRKRNCEGDSHSQEMLAQPLSLLPDEGYFKFEGTNHPRYPLPRQPSLYRLGSGGRRQPWEKRHQPYPSRTQSFWMS